jgi:DNA-binding response OmpR family regulator
MFINGGKEMLNPKGLKDDKKVKNESNEGRHRVLVVDDDEALAGTMKEILEISGYEAEIALDGQEAKKKVLEGYFHLALLDMKLPDITGTELLKWIKKETPRTLVMMVTGYPNLDNAVESLNFGANAYIMKPINARDFLTFIAAKFKEQNERETGVLEQFLPSYLEAIKDGNLWSLNTIATRLNVPLVVVERTSNFCSSVGLIKYWKNKGVVQKAIQVKTVRVPA